MPRRTRPQTDPDPAQQASPRHTGSLGGSPDARRAAAVGARLLERTRETLESLARQMGARRRNLDRLDRGGR